MRKLNLAVFATCSAVAITLAAVMSVSAECPTSQRWEMDINANGSNARLSAAYIDDGKTFFGKIAQANGMLSDVEGVCNGRELQFVRKISAVDTQEYQGWFFENGDNQKIAGVFQQSGKKYSWYGLPPLLTN